MYSIYQMYLSSYRLSNLPTCLSSLYLTDSNRNRIQARASPDECWTHTLSMVDILFQIWRLLVNMGLPSLLVRKKTLDFHSWWAQETLVFYRCFCASIYVLHVSPTVGINWFPVLPLFGWTPTAVVFQWKTWTFAMVFPWFSRRKWNRTFSPSPMPAPRMPIPCPGVPGVSSWMKRGSTAVLPMASMARWWWNSDTRNNDQNKGFWMDSDTIQWIHHWVFNVFFCNIYIMGFTWAIGDISMG